MEKLLRLPNGKVIETAKWKSYEIAKWKSYWDCKILVIETAKWNSYCDCKIIKPLGMPSSKVMTGVYFWGLAQF